MKERLNRLIEEKKLTATKFATLIDANPSAISHILKGRNKPGYDLLVNIGKAFPDISMDWLITGKGDMYNTINNKVTTNIPPKQNTLPLPDLFHQEPKEEKKTDIQKSESKPQENIYITSSQVINTKRIVRTILFFDDGSFEDYISLK